MIEDARTTLIDAIKTQLAQHALPLGETQVRYHYRHWEDEELGFSPEGYHQYVFRIGLQGFYAWCGFFYTHSDAILVHFFEDARVGRSSPLYAIQFAPAAQAQLQDHGFAYESRYGHWRKRYRLPFPPAGVVDVVVADIPWVAQLPVTVRSDAD